jgi:methylamine--corrinoid protein Co-methyltransferase
MPVPPWRITSVLRRSETGPLVTEKDFDRRVLVPEIKRVVKEYDIKYDPKTPVPSDDSLAKNIWDAGVDLFLSVGVFCTSTSRRMIFTDDELKEALWNYHDSIELGMGQDRKTWSPRKIEDPKRPGCLFSPVGVRCSEKNYVKLVMAYMQEPLADAVSTPILEKVDGGYTKTHSPFEQLGGSVHALNSRQAAIRVGRPGMAICLTGTALSAAAQIASSNPVWGARPSDIRLVSVISELKTDHDLLNKALHFRQNGANIGTLTSPLYGAYAGIEGTTVLGIASHLQGLMVNQGNYTCYFPLHIRHLNNTSREMFWLVSLSYQALASNSRLISGSNGFAVAGPCTEMVMYEAGLHGMVSAVSGASVLWEIATAQNKHFERTTPMEARMGCETGLSAVKSKLKRSDVNEIVKEIIPKYEGNFENAPMGKTFEECYDLETLEPSKEYQEIYGKVKAEFRDLGIDYIY